MNTLNYQSPSAFLILHYKMSVQESNLIIENWLKQHPQESRSSLSKLLESQKVLVKNNRLFDLPQLSLSEATELAHDIVKSNELSIKDRRYQLANYQQCFIGSELVDWLIKHKNCLEPEAVAIGQSLLEHNLIAHVLNEHEFENKFLFYHFPKQGVVSNQTQQRERLLLSLPEATRWAQDLQKDSELEVKDRRYRLKNYRRCFVGSELVDLLCKSKNITPEQAVAMGQSLLEHNLIAHVHNEHQFENKFLFYRFQD
ncbi:MAG: DEP domain-containing protein [Cyanobacteria bacterium P01_G01_bin.39]